MDSLSQLALAPVSRPTILQILEGKVQHRFWAPWTARPGTAWTPTPWCPGGVSPVRATDDAAVSRSSEQAEAELVLGHVQVQGSQDRQVQLLPVSLLHLLAETPMRTSSVWLNRSLSEQPDLP